MSWRARALHPTLGATLALSSLLGCSPLPAPRQSQVQHARLAVHGPSESPASTSDAAIAPSHGTSSPGIASAPVRSSSQISSASAGSPSHEQPIEDDGGEALEDDVQMPAPAASTGSRTIRSPLADLTDAELERKLVQDPSSVGSMSIGRTNGGRLVNGVQMPAGVHWEVIDPAHTWGTQETVDALVTCIELVNRQFPNSPRMQIGHISARRGGHLSPHRSHQAGRDVDVSYYYTKPARWFMRANAKNLDRARTWAFIRALASQTDVEMILIDAGLQRLLRQYAIGIGEDEAWVDDLFRGVRGKRPPLIRHARGHATHMHVRFYSPIAQETARRVVPLLVKLGKMDPPVRYVMHRARKGDTLGHLANKYGTTVEAIKRANGLHGTLIRAKRTYRIPRKGNAPPARHRPLVVPPRRLPPHPPTNLPAPASGP